MTSHDFFIGFYHSRATGDALIEETYNWLHDTNPELHGWLCAANGDWDLSTELHHYLFETALHTYRVTLRLFAETDAVLYALRWL